MGDNSQRFSDAEGKFPVKSNSIQNKFALATMIVVGFAALFSSVSAHSQDDQASLPRIAPVKVFGGWNNDNCLVDGTAFNGCLMLMADLVQVVNSDYYLRLKTELGKDWVPVTDERGKRVLSDPNYVVVKSSAQRLSRLQRLTLFDPPKYREQSRLYTITMAGLEKRKYVPVVDFKKMIFDIFDKLTTEEAREAVAAQFLISVWKQKDPFLIVEDLRPRKTEPAVRASIGFQLFPRDQKTLVIGRVEPLGPFDRAGIGVGDAILKFNGQAINPLNLHEVFQKGIPAGPDLTLTTRNPENLQRDLVIRGEDVRDTHWVRSYSILVNHINVGVIEIDHFESESVCQQIQHEIVVLQEQKMAALIYDVRDNPGGLTEQVLCLAGLHLGPQKHVLNSVLLKEAPIYEFARTHGKPESEALLTSSDKIFDQPIPVVMLMNWRTISAAELMVDIFRHMDLSWTVGQRTFGKGIGQSILVKGSEFGDDFGVRETFTRLENLDGSSVQAIGVAPDYEVSHPVTGIDGEKYAVRLTDIYEPLFKSSQVVSAPSEIRKNQKLKLDQCVAQKQLIAEPGAVRWLRDQQLLKAVEVALCNAEDAKTWKE